MVLELFTILLDNPNGVILAGQNVSGRLCITVVDKPKTFKGSIQFQCLFIHESNTTFSILSRHLLTVQGLCLCGPHIHEVKGPWSSRLLCLPARLQSCLQTRPCPSCFKRFEYSISHSLHLITIFSLITDNLVTASEDFFKYALPILAAPSMNYIISNSQLNIP